MELLPKNKIMLLVLAVFIGFAVVVTEDIATTHLDHHECIGEKNGCPVCKHVKAAADFLDTLKLAGLLIPFTIFLVFLAQILKVVGEFIICSVSLVTLKVRINP